MEGKVFFSPVTNSGPRTFTNWWMDNDEEGKGRKGKGKVFFPE
jgi:hypothetical protein